ncbi:receptor activity-modifying protein 2 [Rhinoderma darwinii]|uniref:receptor activity-modifying protein 2 n=1 Tax=Rhinoderma darwinii TaxID=43563 RepID=UPI003F660F5D
MESTILCMLISTLCLFTWAFGSKAASESVTQPAVNISISNGAIFNTSNGTVYTNETIYETIAEICWEIFNSTMFHTKQEHWCNWEHTVSIYDRFQNCLENSADHLYISYPNELAHNTFLNAHMQFFKDCNLLSEELIDPPENILFGLIFAPICIIPFLVTLVVYKSNTSKPQT